MSLPRPPIRPLLYALAALASEPAVADGEAVLPPQELVYCTVCHGADLQGNSVLKAPRLSGLAPWYVERQLAAFSEGWRGTRDADASGIEMRPMAMALSAGQIGNAARYVAAASSPAPDNTVRGDSLRGRSLYASCGACHGAAGAGSESLGAPSLLVQNDWYLLTQLENYRLGARGFHPADVYGQQMRAAAELLPDDEAIRDVVAYISTLQRQ
ncbi:MAG: c-type cytochrome [Woeseiaceae bacterium]